MKHAATFIVTLLVIGCQSPAPESFFPADPGAATQAILDAQTARGARADATLHELHFDGEALASLGRAKLDQVIRDNSRPLPVTIYLDLPADDPYARARSRSVADHLTAAGLLPAQFKTQLGPNPDAPHPTAPLLQKSDNAAAPAAPSPSSSPAAAGVSMEQK